MGEHDFVGSGKDSMQTSPAYSLEDRQRLRSARQFWQRREAVVFPLLLFLVLRLVTGAVAYGIAQEHSIPPPDWIYLNASGATYALVLPADAPFYAVSLPWQRYDTLWYTKNALQGYRNDPGIVFLPLYGLLIGLIAPLTGGNYVFASLIVSNAACAATFLLLYQLVRDEFGAGVARRALLCLAAFPTAYYLVAGYSEPLFLALTLGALLLAQRRRWGLAGLLALLASLTRLQGLILCLPLGWITWRETRSSSWRETLMKLPAVLGAPLGTGLYLLYLRVSGLGPPDVFYASEWHSETQGSWVSVTRFVERWLNGQTLYYEGDNAVVLLVFLGLSLLVCWKLKPYHAVYAGMTLVVLLMRSYDAAQFESMFRYVLLLFPCFIVLGILLRHRLALGAYLVVGAIWQAILLSRFVQWVWVA